MTRILALDLGTTTGFALIGPGVETSGEWQLKEKRHQSQDIRYVNLSDNVDQVLFEYGIDELWYEAVQRHVSTYSAQVYGGYVATVQAWCNRNGIPFRSAGVGEIKKFATGKGNASKTDMVEYARKIGYDIKASADNEADAIALARYAISTALFGKEATS
jgi:Holliday junction resolvasome RuvABC endonuclease subunit